MQGSESEQARRAPAKQAHCQGLLPDPHRGALKERSKWLARNRARNREVGRLQFAAVSRRLLSFLLLIVFLCQSLPVLASQGIAQRSLEIEHVTLHWQDTDHHHHDDRSLHVEDTDDDAQHVHADAGVNTWSTAMSLSIEIYLDVVNLFLLLLDFTDT